MGKDGQIRVGPRELSPLQIYREIHSEKKKSFIVKFGSQGPQGSDP